MSHANKDMRCNGHMGCAKPKMERKTKPCGCTSVWVCKACGYEDLRRQDDHDERCKR